MSRNNRTGQKFPDLRKKNTRYEYRFCFSLITYGNKGIHEI